MAAERTGASLYAVVQAPPHRTHLASTAFDPSHSPRLASFLEHVDVAIAVHGYGRALRHHLLVTRPYQGVEAIGIDLSSAIGHAGIPRWSETPCANSTQAFKNPPSRLLMISSAPDMIRSISSLQVGMSSMRPATMPHDQAPASMSPSCMMRG